MDKNKRYLTRLGSLWGGGQLCLDLVPEHSLIISCGLAHDISLDVELIKRKKCCVIGVDPTLLALKTVLKYKFRSFKSFRKMIRNYFFISELRFFRNKMRPDDTSQIRLLRKAVHGKSDLKIRLGGPAQTALSPYGRKYSTISLEDLILTYQGASVLKLDIEGAEFPAIENLAVKLRIPQLMIAFHIWLNGSSDKYPSKGVPASIYTPEDVSKAVSKIKSMGYKLVYQEAEDAERVGQECLFIRSDMAAKFEDLELNL